MSSHPDSNSCPFSLVFVFLRQNRRSRRDRCPTRATTASPRRYQRAGRRPPPRQHRALQGRATQPAGGDPGRRLSAKAPSRTRHKASRGSKDKRRRGYPLRLRDRWSLCEGNGGTVTRSCGRGGEDNNVTSGSRKKRWRRRTSATPPRRRANSEARRPLGPSPAGGGRFLPPAPPRRRRVALALLGCFLSRSRPSGNMSRSPSGSTATTTRTGGDRKGETQREGRCCPQLRMAARQAIEDGVSVIFAPMAGWELQAARRAGDGSRPVEWTSRTLSREERTAGEMVV